MKSFEGKNGTRTVYLLILVFTLFSGLIVGGFVSYALSYIPFFTKNRVGVFLSVFINHIVMLLTLELFLKKLFQTSVIVFVCGKEKNAGRFILITLITAVVYTLGELLTEKNVSVNSTDTAGLKVLFFALSAILFLPQTLIEEALFRVLPERTWSPEGEQRTSLEKVLLSLVCGILFIVPHLLNSEVTSFSPVIPIVTYFLWGFLASLLGQTEGSYLTAWAMHYANNLFSVTAVGLRGTTLTGAPLFYSEETGFSPFLPLTVSLLFLIVFLIDRLEKKKGRHECTGI